MSYTARTVCLSFSISFLCLGGKVNMMMMMMMTTMMTMTMTTLTPPPPSCLIHSQTSSHFSHMHYFAAFKGGFLWSVQEWWTEVSLYTHHKSIQGNDTEHTRKYWQKCHVHFDKLHEAKRCWIIVDDINWNYGIF